MSTNSTSIQASFIWESTSYYQYFKQRLGLAPLTSDLLLKELESNPNSQSTLCRVVAFLTHRSHFGLEQALKDKIAEKPTSQMITDLQSVAKFSLETGRLKMIEVCKRIVALDQLKSGSNVANVQAIAKIEAQFISQPPRIIEKISDSVWEYWYRYSSIFGKIIHCLDTVAVGTLTTIAFSVISPLNSPPTNILEVQGSFDVFRYLTHSFFTFKDAYLNLFSTKKKAAQVGLMILIGLIGIHYIHNRLRLGIPTKLDKYGYFRDLTPDVKDGTIKQMKGRSAEKTTAATAWATLQGENIRIVLPVGPTGCGKTEFVKGLAWESVNDPKSFVYGKRIFAVNTIQLAQKDTRYMDDVFKLIAGHENDIVLFFDEAHSAGSQKGKLPWLLEYLKTKIPEKRIRCIFATTEEEYADMMAHNKAFVDRCTYIPFKELPDLGVKNILNDMVKFDEERINEVDPAIYDLLLYVSHTDKTRYNPRKVIDLYKNVRSYVDGWKPERLKNEIETLEAEKDDFKAVCTTALDNDEKWSNSPAGEKALLSLELMKQQITEKNKQLTGQNLELQKIARLQALQPQYRKRYNELLHVIADQKEDIKDSKESEKAQKEFLYLKYILRPALQENIQNEARKFQETYKETIPLKIDAALIKNQFPDVFLQHISPVKVVLPSLSHLILTVDTTPTQPITTTQPLKLTPPQPVSAEA